MDEETRDAIGGAYQFAGNILLAVAVKLSELGLTDREVEAVFQTLGATNPALPGARAQATAEAVTSATLAAFRSRNDAAPG